MRPSSVTHQAISRGREKRHSRQLRKKRDCGGAHLTVAGCFMQRLISEGCSSAPYIMSVRLKVNARGVRLFPPLTLGIKGTPKIDPKNESGRGPPTSPTLRPRVLTPRDHFAHRGGGRGMIMHKSYARCNPRYVFFPCLARRLIFLTPHIRIIRNLQDFLFKIGKA
jgi:hypothetical protein